MNLDKGFIIDSNRMDNASRFINHPRKPNCEIQKWLVNGMPRIYVFTKSDIKNGNEIKFDNQY